MTLHEAKRLTEAWKYLPPRCRSTPAEVSMFLMDELEKLEAARPPEGKKKFLYVICCVEPPNPETVSVFNSITEKVSGPVPDVIPTTHPAGMTFQHRAVVASNEDEAYAIGARLVEWKGVCNDYVVELTGSAQS